MKRHRLLAFGFFVFQILFTAAPSIAGDLIFVAHPSLKVSEISANDIRELYLGETTSLGDSAAAPVILLQQPAYDALLRLLGKTETAFHAAWRMHVFTGKGTLPRRFNDEKILLDFIRSTPGTVSYISAAAAPPGIKVLRLKR